MDYSKVFIDEIEEGYGFVTIWGFPYQELLALSDAVFDSLPEETQSKQLGKEKCRHHKPELYHPFGTAVEVGRKHYKHFHVIDTKADDILSIFKSLKIPTSNIQLTKLEDRNPQELKPRTVKTKIRKLLNKLQEPKDAEV